MIVARVLTWTLLGSARGLCRVRAVGPPAVPLSSDLLGLGRIVQGLKAEELPALHLGFFVWLFVVVVDVVAVGFLEWLQLWTIYRRRGSDLTGLAGDQPAVPEGHGSELPGPRVQSQRTHLVRARLPLACTLLLCFKHPPAAGSVHFILNHAPPPKSRVPLSFTSILHPPQAATSVHSISGFPAQGPAFQV